VSKSKGVSLCPGISPQEMHEIWEEALERAETYPGRTITLFLAPGEYPLPEVGEYVYRASPTVLRVSEPGVEVRFRHNRASGTTEITTVSQRTMRRTA
jgi:hypothetical protein